MNNLEKISVILQGIVIIWITSDYIGRYLWKRKCDKELAENLKKIDKEYIKKLEKIRKK